MKICLSDDELRMLLSNSETEIVTRRFLKDGAVHCDADECDELRDACADLLQRIGFDNEYAPTEAGILLERLIDKLLV